MNLAFKVAGSVVVALSLGQTSRLPRTPVAPAQANLVATSVAQQRWLHPESSMGDPLAFASPALGVIAGPSESAQTVPLAAPSAATQSPPQTTSTGMPAQVNGVYLLH